MNNEVWTVKKVLHWMVDKFKEKNIANPRLDGEILIALTLKIDRVGVYLNLLRPLSDEERDILRNYVKRRLSGEPIAYITGEKAFYSIDLKVTDDVLIPRPDTEILVEKTLEKLTSGAKILDIGTGSGAIALSIKKENSDVKVFASDISEKALKIAKENGKNLNLDVNWFLGSLFSPFPGEKFNIIVSNPPYIPIGTELQLEVQKEPQSALFAKERGLKILFEIIESAPDYLEKNGWLLMEFGENQENELIEKYKKHNFENVEIVNDYSGMPRVVMGKIR
jgi:release factor glutamine methyltransferase